MIFDAVRERLSRLEVVYVDQGDSGENFARKICQVCGDSVRVEGIKYSAKTFEVLPKRWIAERTFGWLNRYRQLSKDGVAASGDERSRTPHPALSRGERETTIRLMLRRMVA